MVAWKGMEIKFDNWLLALPPVAEIDVLGDQGYKELFQWHSARGAQNRCSRLDNDVMSIVLLHAIGDVRHVDDDRMGGFSIVRKHVNTDRFMMMGGRHSLVVQSVDGRVMCLNKQLAEIARRALEFHTIKTFDMRSSLPDTISAAPSRFLASLSRIQLSLTDDDYLYFFHVKLPGLGLAQEYAHHLPQCAALRRLPNLNYLELRFDSPYNKHGYSQIDWDPSNITQSSPGACKFLQYPCRRTLVDYIMCFAYQHIVHIRSVNITGYVKTETRNHWLRILQDGPNWENHMAAVKMRIDAIQKQPVANL